MEEKWWAYVHVTGTVQVKRFFDHEDIVEAEKSSFVAKIYGPFNARDREEALRIATHKLI